MNTLPFPDRLFRCARGHINICWIFPAIYLSDLGLRDCAHYVYAFLRENERGERNEVYSQLYIYWSGILSVWLLGQLSETRKTPSLVRIIFCVKYDKKRKSLYRYQRYDAVKINWDIRSSFASSFKYLFHLCHLFWGSFYHATRTLVLSNYRSSKVTLISFSMYKI